MKFPFRNKLRRVRTHPHLYHNSGGRHNTFSPFTPLSSAEASLCCGEAGEKEKESARRTMGRVGIVPRALSIFPIILIWWGYPAGASAEERGPFWEKREPASTANSVGCLWHSHGKNPVRLYPKLQSQPIGLPKIFIDYLFFQADQSDCTKSVSIFNRSASSEGLWKPNLSR